MKNVLALFTLVQLLFVPKIFGQFSSPNLIDTNYTQITNIITADINNDSFKDIIVTRKFSSTFISYYLNQGDLTFGPETTLATGSNYISRIAAGDFNADGWIDIVSIGDGSDDVIVYTNDSTTFTADSIDSFTIFNSAVEVADIDNDADLDFVAIGGTTLKIYYNDGFSNFTSDSIAGPIEDFVDLTINDIDGDGFKDIITSGANISIYQNTNGVISYDSTRTSLIPSDGNFFVELEDLDNDGDLDLFSDGNINNGIRWMENDGNGNFSNLQIIDFAPNNNRYGASINDFDADGDLDIIAPKEHDFVLYTNDGLGNFDTAQTIQQGLPLITVIHSEDINNDGLYDAIWSANLSFQLNNTTPLSVIEIEMDEEIIISPNPASSLFSIISLNPGTLTIHNALGQVVRENIHLVEGTNSLDLNLLPQLYFLTIQSQNEKTIKKLLIH